MKLRTAAVLGAILLTGCAARKPVAPVTYGVSEDKSYIDLQPGWRLRVITPLLKSGGYRVKSVEQTSTGNNVELRTDSDFLGYEQAYYTVPQKGRPALTSVEAFLNGVPERRKQPKARLFEWPREDRFCRLIFLTRVSDADHDMAVLTAARREDLDAMTNQLRNDPDGACKATPHCSWVPGGIAVRPEKLDAATGTWIPADAGSR
jgi:hypothetical protein